ncbi:hypothetical protein [Mycobacterium sp. E3247]|uniref:DUF7379 domain-containing protein n=1 Tax=Mycobacterium sp. E3247 TaxID=1856864 RepID=UPI0007FC34ED|nr:hypothetical protein [Mycobacterium sp. E3247]OBH16039.1 hypothetical protein A9X04_12475 [Mycobacterium sp. E3247]
MSDLNGSTDRIALGPGIFVQAPGLVGTVELLEPRLLGTRAGEERATAALSSALERQQFTTMHSLEINAQPVIGPAAPVRRGPDERPLLSIEVPDIGPEQPQVAMLADEQGIITWHFAQTSAVPGTVQFEVPADTVTTGPTAATGEQRGLVYMIGKKLLSVLVFPLMAAGAQALAEHLAKSWEESHRKAALRLFSGPDDCATVTPVEAQSWDRLASGPALLFIHGTCSTSQGGFGALDSGVWGQLNYRYGGRLFAYDHPTLSVDPLANVDALAGLIPPGMRFDVDIIAHSRGGLVARTIACAGNDGSFPLHVNKIVHVGVPNAGTALANVERHSQFVDRLSTLLNLAPDGPLSVVADILDGVLTIVKIIGCNGIGSLPGLHAMDPASGWLSALGAKPFPPFAGYAIDADFEPVGGLLKLVRVPDGIADLVFGLAPNDIVVPAGGVYDAGTALGFPIPRERTVSFAKDEHVWHCAYFGQQKTGSALLRWLPTRHERISTA